MYDVCGLGLCRGRRGRRLRPHPQPSRGVRVRCLCQCGPGAGQGTDAVADAPVHVARVPTRRGDRAYIPSVLPGSKCACPTRGSRNRPHNADVARTYRSMARNAARRSRFSHQHDSVLSAPTSPRLLLQKRQKTSSKCGPSWSSVLSRRWCPANKCPPRSLASMRYVLSPGKPGPH